MEPESSVPYLQETTISPCPDQNGLYLIYTLPLYTGMRRKATFRSTTDLIYDSGPIRLYHNIILYYNTYHCVTFAYNIQYSNMLYRFVA